MIESPNEKRVSSFLGRYAMREALALVGEEGLEAMWARHQRMHEDLWTGLKALGLEPFVENPDERLITVNTIKVPLCPLQNTPATALLTDPIILTEEHAILMRWN